MGQDSINPVWVTGEEVSDFTNWLSGQPTLTTRDNCGSISKSLKNGLSNEYTFYIRFYSIFYN